MKINAQDTLSFDEIEVLKAKAAEADLLRAELVQARELLKAEKEGFYKFFDNLPFFAYLQEKDYSIRFANRVFRDSYGESAGRRCHGAARRHARAVPPSAYSKPESLSPGSPSIRTGRPFRSMTCPLQIPTALSLYLR